MTLTEQIREGRYRFEAFYGRRPDAIYIGDKQAAEIDELFERLKALGYVTDKPAKRATIDGLTIYRVEAENHLGFGLELPSPCG